MQKTTASIVSFVCAVFYCASAATARKEDSNKEMMTLAVEESARKEGPDDVAREKALYSKEAGLCAKAYFEGDKKAAEGYLIKVLSRVQTCKSIHALIKTLHGRVVMYSSEDADPKCYGLSLYQSALAAVEKSCGPEHRFVADALDFIGDYYEDTKDWKDAVSTRTRELRVRQKNPRDDFDRGDVEYSLALDYHALHDRKHAQQYIEAAVATFHQATAAVPVRESYRYRLYKALKLRDAIARETKKST